MKLPLQISFHGLSRSDALEATVRERAEKLDRFSSDIMSCRVTLTLLEKHKHQGKPIGVQIAVTLPGQEVVTGREQNEDPYVALRDAFDNMTRMLQEAMRKRRDPIKIPPS